MFKKSGFTLIELLIVISIISVLALIGLVAYGNFIKASRNNRRMSDLKLIQSALEDYHSDQLYYPNSLGTSVTSGSKTYLNTVPTDPKGGTYSYAPSGCTSVLPQTCTSYCLYAAMEGGSYASDSVCNSPPSGYTYGITRP